MGKGRAEFLQKHIIKAIINAVEKKELPPDWIVDIFGSELLTDTTIKQELLEHWKPEKILINDKS